MTEQKARPLFTVISIVKDHPDGLRDTLESVVTQDGIDLQKDVQLVVINGGEEGDATSNVMDEYRDAISFGRSKPDKGIYNAMNVGLDYAIGKYTIFMNGGDSFADKDVLAKTSDLIRNNPRADLILGNAILHDGKIFTAQSLEHNQYSPAIHQSIFYETDKIGDLRYAEKHKTHADHLFNKRYNQKVKNPVYTNFNVARYEGGGVSAKLSSQESWDRFFDVYRDAKKGDFLRRIADKIGQLGENMHWPFLDRAKEKLYDYSIPRDEKKQKLKY